MVVRLFLPLALLAAVCGSAEADDASSHKIECDRLSFSFEPVQSADEAYCYRYTHSSAGGDDGVAGHSAVFEHMLVYQGAEVIRISIGRAVEGVYFSRRPLSGYIKEFDELEHVESWSGEADYKDYNVAQFKAKLDDQAVTCYGFMTTGGDVVSRRGGSIGAGSFLAGYDCQFGSGALSRSLIEQTLAAIK
jgi:hypothetical protein